MLCVALLTNTQHTSLRSLPTSTGCTYLSASSTSCAYWFTSAFKGPHRATGRTPSARSRVRNHGVACAPRHRPISSCRRRDVQQWAQDRAFAVAAPRAWDSLPDAIRRSAYTTAEHRVPELILVLGSHIAGDINPALGCHYFPPGR